MRLTLPLSPASLASLTAIAALTTVFSCAHGEPPGPMRFDGGNASAVAIDVPFDARAIATQADAVAQARDAGPTAVDAGPDPSTLPQTEDKPEARGAAFDTRTMALWDAIANDDPDHAMPFFFPLGAYKQVKAIGNPEADWHRRLVANFTRDIHALHARLAATGGDAGHARFVRVDVPQDTARWIEPGEESNKLGYYRVYGTRIYYEIDGKSASFNVSSLISWRGEWYVVHLSGFK